MDQHLGASITLSFALVVVFAIVLYQPEKPPVSSFPPDRTREVPPEPPSSTAVPIPPVTPGEPLPEPAPHAASVPPSPLLQEVERFPENRVETIATHQPEPERRVRTSGVRTRPRATTLRETAGASPVATSEALSTAREVPGLPSHDAFTLSNEGETLRDVAIRIYGSADEVEALWRLNRDLIGRRDVTLAAGTLLRTPARIEAGRTTWPSPSVADQSPLRK